MLLSTARALAALAATCVALSHGPAHAAAETEPLLPVVGTSLPYPLVPDLSAAVRGSDTFLWVHAVELPPASFTKVHFENMNLRAGDVLTLRDGRGEVVETLIGRGFLELGTFWALSARGAELFLEFEFHAPYAEPPFQIDQIIAGTAGFTLPGAPAPKSECGTADYADAVCYQADAGKWANVMGSTGVMFVSGNPATALFCSGANVSPQNYVLTNYHCIANDVECGAAEFVFKYYRTTCNSGGPATTDWKSFHCSHVVASQPLVDCNPAPGALDFALCSMQGDAAALFGFVTPDPTPLTDGEAVYIVQHPNGDPHELTHGAGANVDVDGHVLRYYGTLDTASGSSGSPIFRESDDKLVGLHHCGGCSTPGTGNRGMLMSDVYPAIASFLCASPVGLTAAAAPAPVELYGDGDVDLDPGETWQYTPALANASCSTSALGVTAELAPAPGALPILVLDPIASFGTIAPGATKAAAVPIRFVIPPQAACGSAVRLDLKQIQAANAGPFPDAPNVVATNLGTVATTPLYFENFPVGFGTSWKVVDGGAGGGPAATWTDANPGNEILSLVPPYAIADSKVLGSFAMDEQLISSSIDCSAYTGVELSFKHVFEWVATGGAEKGTVSIRSPITGGAWIDVLAYQGQDVAGAAAVDISAMAAGQSNVQVRFRYSDAFQDGFWAVDDVAIFGDNGAACSGSAFTTSGGGCPGTGKVPQLAATGSSAAGGAMAVAVASGTPFASGLLFVAGGSPLPGPCLLVAPPYALPLPMPLDGSGAAEMQGQIPPPMPAGFAFHLQWLGANKSFSNRITVGVQ